MKKNKYNNLTPSVDDIETSSHITLPFAFASPVSREEASDFLSNFLSEQLKQGKIPTTWIKLGEPKVIRHAELQPKPKTTLLKFHDNNKVIYVMAYCECDEDDAKLLQSYYQTNKELTPKAPYYQLVNRALQDYFAIEVPYEILNKPLEINCNLESEETT